ncbi:MAG: O-antigen ligase family protein [Syntrophothermus sp.]
MKKLYRQLINIISFVFIFAIYNDNFTVDHLGANALKLIFLAFILINLPAIIRNFATPDLMSNLMPFFLFTALVFFSMLIGLPAGEELVPRLTENIMIIISMVIIMVYFIDYDLKKTLWFIWVTMASSSLIALFNSPISRWTFRKTGGTGDPNEFASQILAFLFISIFLFKENKNIPFLIFSLGAFAYSILFAGSMSSILMLVVLMAFVMIRFMKMSFTKSMIVILITLTAGMSTMIALKDKLENVEVINNILGRASNTGTADTRFNSWGAGLKMITEKPLTGVGMREYGEFSPKYSSKYLGPDSVAPHNLYIEIMAESGLIVFFAFAFFLIDLLSRSFGAITHSDYFWIYMAVVSYLLMGMTIGITYNKFFWITIALLKQVQMHIQYESAGEVDSPVNIGTV